MEWLKLDFLGIAELHEGIQCARLTEMMKLQSTEDFQCSV